MQQINEYILTTAPVLFFFRLSTTADRLKPTTNQQTAANPNLNVKGN